MDAICNATRLARSIMSRQVKKGDTVIDATCGTGQDTLFLARLVGQDGRVLAFDIQEKAIKDTTELLYSQGCLDQVALFRDNHINLQSYIKNGVSAGMFNLGYMPGGDHSIITNPFDTVLAVNRLLEVLQPGGILTVVSYPGHPGGEEESAALQASLKDLPQQRFEVLFTRFINQVNHPPQYFYINKLINYQEVY